MYYVMHYVIMTWLVMRFIKIINATRSSAHIHIHKWYIQHSGQGYYVTKKVIMTLGQKWNRLYYTFAWGKCVVSWSVLDGRGWG